MTKFSKFKRASLPLSGSESILVNQKGATSLADIDDLYQKGIFDQSIALSDRSTPLSPGKVGYWVTPFGASSVRVRITVDPGTRSSSGIVSIDVKKGGVSIFTTIVSIDAGEVSSTTAATPAVMAADTFASGDVLEFYIVSPGTGACALVVTISGEVEE